MEVLFSPEVEAELLQAAANSGKSAQQFVQDSIGRILQRRNEYIRSVEEGLAAAEHGDFVEHEEAVRQINQVLHS